MKKLWKSFISLFSSKFVHPVIDAPLQTAITDKLNARRNEQEIETNKQNEILNSYLRTYFSTPYLDNKEMAVAFDITNKQWKEHCKQVNRSNKLINVNKESFQNRVKLTVEQLKKNKDELQKK